MDGDVAFTDESGGEIVNRMGVVKLDLGFGFYKFFQLAIDFPGVHVCQI